MITITKEVNVDLLFEELEEQCQTVELRDGERHTNLRIIKTKDGVLLVDSPIGAELVVLAHDPTKKSKKEIERERKEEKRNAILDKLKITKEELADLLG